MSKNEITISKSEYLTAEIPLALFLGVDITKDMPSSVRLVELIPYGATVSVLDKDTYCFVLSENSVENFLKDWVRGISFGDEFQCLPHNPQAPHPTISVHNYPIENEIDGLSITVWVGGEGMGAVLDYSAVEKLEVAITKYKNLVA